MTLATNELYAKSALALLKTLKNAETKHQIVLMLANEHTIGVELIRILNNAFDKVVSVDKLINEHSSKYDVLSTRPELAGGQVVKTVKMESKMISERMSFAKIRV